MNKLKARVIRYPQKDNSWRTGMKLRGGKHKPNVLNLMWHLLETVRAQPSRPERLVLFRLTCLTQAARAC